MASLCCVAKLLCPCPGCTSPSAVPRPIAGHLLDTPGHSVRGRYQEAHTDTQTRRHTHTRTHAPSACGNNVISLPQQDFFAPSPRERTWGVARPSGTLTGSEFPDGVMASWLLLCRSCILPEGLWSRCPLNPRHGLQSGSRPPPFRSCSDQGWLICLHVSETKLASWWRPSLLLFVLFFGVVVARRCYLLFSRRGREVVDKVRGLIRQYHLTRDAGAQWGSVRPAPRSQAVDPCGTMLSECIVSYASGRQRLTTFPPVDEANLSDTVPPQIEQAQRSAQA